MAEQNIELEKYLRKIGAERYERSEERATHRNGYRERNWETRVGDVALRIPKLRRGLYYPSFLDPRRSYNTCLGGDRITSV
jgi:transposase-like protein